MASLSSSNDDEFIIRSWLVDLGSHEKPCFSQSYIDRSLNGIKIYFILDFVRVKNVRTVYYT